VQGFFDMTATRVISLQTARRLAVASQFLDASPRPMLDTIRQMGCLQLDPTKAVIQNQYLVLWSRLGNYAMRDFDRLMWDERVLFEYWAHAASIVLTEHYPLHARIMNASRQRRSGRHQWVQANQELYAYVLHELRENGAMPLKKMQGNDSVSIDAHSNSWSSWRNLDRMVLYLWIYGEVLVSGRVKGGFRNWDLAERVLPSWTPREALADDEAIRQSLLIALNAQGVSTPKQLNYHFVRNEYPDMKQHLAHLEKNAQIERVTIQHEGATLKGDWVISNLALLERIEHGEWQPRTALLSPFDNLLCDRARTEQLFDFYFRIEIYVPKHKRQYGYFVMPILYGDQLIGRIDPQYDRKSKTLMINAVHWQNTPTAEQQRAVDEQIASLQAWLRTSIV
jgi:uncharacterized protein